MTLDTVTVADLERIADDAQIPLTAFREDITCGRCLDTHWQCATCNCATHECWNPHHTEKPCEVCCD